eukprot:PhM_4_TR4279/c0_g1_i1/m.15522
MYNSRPSSGLPPRGIGGNTTTPTTTTSASKTNIPCKFFSNGGICRNGDACRFVHSHEPVTCSYGLPPPRIGGSTTTPTTTTSASKIHAPCKFFSEGNCGNGDACRFMHTHEPVTCLFGLQCKV